MSDIKASKENQTLSMPQSVAMGSVLGVIITVLLLIVFALVLSLSNISDSTVTAFSYAATVIGSFIGAYFASSKLRKNGLMTGFLTLALYLTLMFIIKIIFTGLNNISVLTLAYIGITLLSSLFGGVAGVNKKRR